MPELPPWLRRHGASVLWFIVVVSAIATTAINRVWFTWVWTVVICALVGYALIRLRRG